MLFDQNVVVSIFRHFTYSFHGNQLFCNIQNTFEMKNGFSPASGFYNYKAIYIRSKLMWH